MAVIVIVQYNGGFLPDILLLTQAPNVVWFGGTIIVYSIITTLLIMYYLYIVFSFVWWPCMAINTLRVQYNGGLVDTPSPEGRARVLER